MRYIIAGAPCAGKSTYARENARAGDLIYDYDTLHMALSGQDSHNHSEAIRPYVIAARDAVFAQIEAHKTMPAWIVTSSRKQAEIEALAQRMEAEIVFLEISKDEAHARCKAASRPAEWHDYIDNWFAESDIALAKRKPIMNTKTFTAPIQFKAQGEADTETGEFEATFATLRVKDHHGDVTLPGAFTNGQAVIVEGWNHDYSIPAGSGVIHADEERAWVEGRFFLDTQAGRENYRTIKNLGNAEWSYTFDILQGEPGEWNGEQVRLLKSLDVVGVSPVTRGAGINTGTVVVKSKTSDEGEANGKPSGASPDVIRLKLSILEME
jgi:predicted kinase